jgi:alpha-tubulin suppressor-like RCC1 family protein
VRLGDDNIYGMPSALTELERLFMNFRGQRFFCGVVLFLTLTMAAMPGARAAVIAWGAGTTTSGINNYGQSIVPADVTNAVMVAGGLLQGLALNADGTLADWGTDGFGVLDFFQDTNYISVACGRQHSLALFSDGTVVAVGDDSFGQIDVPSGLTNVVEISGGFYHSLALKSDGTVVVWGPGTNVANVGQDPDYGQTIVPLGLSNVVQIAAGGWHNVALLADGTIRTWGRSDSGQLAVPPGLSNVVAISAGAAHTVVLRADGSIVAWGLNLYGETNVPTELSNVIAIASGGWHNLALKSDGTVVAWGAGTGTNVYVDNQQNIVPAHLTNVVQIAGGNVNSLVITGSAPPVTSAKFVTPQTSTNGFTVAIPTRNGHVYRLEYTPSLAAPSWTGLPLVAGTGGLQTFSDPSATNNAGRFYRVRRW